MATRLKTIEYWFPLMATAADATETNFTQITVYIPEGGGALAFQSVTLEVQAHNADTTAQNTTRRQLSLRVGAAGYTAINNTNALTASGENYCFQCTGDFTSHFTTNWTGTSMTCDATVLFDTAGSEAYRNITGRLYITYTYDDTQATHVKTVYIPLDAPVGALATSKPGTANATIPDLSTFLPEDSITIRQRTIVVQGNIASAATADLTLSLEVDTIGPVSSQAYEQALASDYWFRFTDQTNYTTNASHSFYIWADVAKFNHLQIYIVVTYEFAPSTSTTILNSLLLPMEFDSPAGGTTSSDYQRSSRCLWIEEPSTITKKESALFLFFDTTAAATGLAVKVNDGSFTAYTDTAAVVCGGNGLMRRCENDLTLVRGKNTLKAEVYRTSATVLVTNMSAVWMINYTSSKATDGVGAHNHTVFKTIATQGTAAAAYVINISATSFSIPETYYYLTGIGVHYQYVSNTTGTPGGVGISVERLAEGEGGVIWEPIYYDVSHPDPEVGLRQCFATARTIFKRFPGDLEAYSGSRLDIETNRRYRVILGAACTGFHNLDFLITYHSIYHTISGNVTGYAGDGSGITIYIFREENDERVLSTTTAAGGGYSFTWYDDTANLYATARQNSTHVGRSDTGIA
jgi:hypothetical protein